LRVDPVGQIDHVHFQAPADFPYRQSRPPFAELVVNGLYRDAEDLRHLLKRQPDYRAELLR
jgi:hypothetical protein